MEGKSRGIPDRVTLWAFALIVLIGGLNFVAVRFSNREIPPFFGAGIRFTIASLLLFAYMGARRIPAPKERALTGTLIYGVLGFAAAYALAYWALVSLASAVAALVMGSVPLLTLILAVSHGIEGFRVRSLVGALIAVVGIGVIVGTPSEVRINIAALLAMLGAAVCAAESGVVIKKFPQAHPVARNAIAMLTGGLLLLVVSRVWGEQWTLPNRVETWVSFVYLVIIGSVALFGLYLLALSRWTASGVSYMFVLTPIVASVAGALLASEAITISLVLGGLVVISGVYFGALSGGPPGREVKVTEELSLKGEAIAPASPPCP